jgi:AcrR family transcriptional regulator
MDAAGDRKNTKAGEIARAALRLFAQKGYAFTSIEQISIEAGIGKSTVYEYYETKEALFVAAIMEAADDWVARLEAVSRETRDPLERLHLIADLYLQKSDQRGKPQSRLFIEVLSQTFLLGGVFYERSFLIKSIHQRIVRIVVDYLLAGVSRGQLDPGIARIAEKIAVNFLAFLDGLHLHSLVEEGYIDSRQQVALFFKHMALLLEASGAG